jgi:hypothetical protein
MQEAHNVIEEQGCPEVVIIELPRAEPSSAWPYHHTVALQLTSLYN